MTKAINEMTPIERAVATLRKPDASMASVANTVRQSMADVIEGQAEDLRQANIKLRDAEARIADLGRYITELEENAEYDAQH